MNILRFRLRFFVCPFLIAFLAACNSDSGTTPEENEETGTPPDESVSLREDLFGTWTGQVSDSTEGRSNPIMLIIERNAENKPQVVITIEGDDTNPPVVPLSRDFRDQVKVRNLEISNEMVRFHTDSVRICLRGGGDGSIAEEAIEVVTWQASIADTLISGTFTGVVTIKGQAGLCKQSTRPSGGIWQVRKAP